MSLTSLASLMNLAGLTKGKGAGIPPGTVISQTAALLLASASPTVSVAVADTYAVSGNSPNVVADFESATEYFRVNGSDTDFETMFDLGTTTAYPTSLGTMVDSDGYIKWGPHNFATTTEDASSWTIQNATVTANATTAPDGTSTADLFEDDGLTGSTSTCQIGFLSPSVVAGSYTIGFYAKAEKTDWCTIRVANYTGASPASGFDVYFDLTNGVVGNDTYGVGSIADAGNGWWKIQISGFTIVSSDVIGNMFIKMADANGDSTIDKDGTHGIYVWGVHIYRDDLGGMVNVPTDQRAAAGAIYADYVPNSSASPRYLHRRGNHVYNGSSYVKKGIQVETESRTNSVPDSIDLGGSYWNQLNLAATPAQNATGPDGDTASAWTITDNNSGGTGQVHVAETGQAVSTSTQYCWSMYLKAGTISWVSLGTYSFTTPANSESYFDLANVAKGTIAAGMDDSGIVDVGNGWRRVWVVFTTDAVDTGGALRLTMATANNVRTSTPLDGTSTLLTYGWQLEAGSTPSSYIPTSGGTVTRTADSLLIPPANMSYSTTAMSFQIDGTITFANEATADDYTIWVNKSGTERVYVRLNANNDRFDFITNNLGTLVSQIGTTTVAAGVNVEFNTAFRLTSTAQNFATNGTAETEAANANGITDFATSGANTELDNNTLVLYNIGQFRQWDVDLGDTGIETAST